MHLQILANVERQVETRDFFYTRYASLLWIY